MSLKSFEIKTTKLNMFQHSGCSDKKQNYNLIANVNMQIVFLNKSIQKVILTYDVNSHEIPVYLMWECTVILNFVEIKNKEITKEDFFKYSDIIKGIDKKLEQLSNLCNIKLPLFSKTISEQYEFSI